MDLLILELVFVPPFQSRSNQEKLLAQAQSQGLSQHCCYLPPYVATDIVLVALVTLDCELESFQTVGRAVFLNPQGVSSLMLNVLEKKKNAEET